MEQQAAATEQQLPWARVRQRIARLGSVRPRSAVLDPLFSVLKQNHPKADLDVIARAYDVAEQYHEGQTRKSGEPYITHPLSVATITAELGMTEPVIVAALLHDTVEDTDYTLEQVRADFSDEVARMVDGVTKLDKLAYGETAKAETIRKMIMATSEEVRVLVIKLADRLHNMRTLGSLREDKQIRIATETLNIFAPLAHRLGMNTIKWELEDLSFKIIEPKFYDEIADMVQKAAPQREAALKELIETFQKLLVEAKINATVYGRPKHYYSIYQKMMVRGRDFRDIYDLIGLRVLVDEVRDCYSVLGVAHAAWKPIPGRFKDYIANPKFNLYQSLHTTVVGANQEPVEFQIRTYDMHRHAEYGVAAHWKYKQQNQRTGINPQEAGLRAIHQLGVMSKETEDPEEFLDSVLFEINADEIFVFTPKGEVTALPVGATPVDFAFSVHTEVGYRCIGARVNGRLVSLSTPLQQGDKVEVLTSKSSDAGPSRDWLNFVVSSRAKQKIRQHFSRERRDEMIEQGKEVLAHDLRRRGVPMQRLLSLEYLTAVANELGQKTVQALYSEIGEGHISAQSVIRKLIHLAGGEDEALDEATEDIIVRPRASKSSATAIVLVDGDDSVTAKFAKCCNPLPGDEIIGFITKGDGVSVHRASCTNAPALLEQRERIIEVKWNRDANAQFLVTLEISGIDRTGLLSDISTTLSQQHIDIISVNIQTNKDREFHGKISFEAADPTHLRHVIAQVRSVPGVYDVFRTAG